MRIVQLGPPMVVALVTVIACAGPTATLTSAPPSSAPSLTPATTATLAAPSPSVAQSPSATDVPTNSATPAGAVFDQPWAVATLTDVTTGEQFRIADVAASGKVVFVETMAIWCTNCRIQQGKATEAFAQLDPSRVEWIGLDIETSETADALARYRTQNGFPFRYAISDASLSRALAQQFGDIVLSPPSVNVIVLGLDGRITHLTGQHSAAEIVALAAEHGA